MFKSILASAVIAASTFLAPAAHALVTTCWWSNGTGTMDAQLCSVSSRVNANNHLVYDVIDHAGNKGTLVFWEDDTAELIFNGKVIPAFYWFDEDGDIRVETTDGYQLAISGEAFE